MQKEPKLEDYELSLSLYEKYKMEYKEENNNLNIINQKIYNSSKSVIGGVLIAIGIVFGLLVFESIIILIISIILGIIISEIEKKNTKELLKEKSNIEKIKQRIKDLFYLYEKDFVEYNKSYLESFYLKKLFKKRSKNEEFNKNLKDFESMIKSVSEKTKNLATISDWRILDEYNLYISKRKFDMSSVHEISDESNTSLSHLKEKRVAPDIKYRVARKIDNWEEINKKRKQTGDKGEEIVLLMEQEYLESINRKDLSQKVSHVSVEKGDSLGYDILSFFENGDNKYIEVKSTTGSIASAFEMSANQLRFLRENIENAFIYRVSFAGDIPEIIVKTATEVLESNIVPTSYIVKNK